MSWVVVKLKTQMEPYKGRGAGYRQVAVTRLPNARHPHVGSHTLPCV